MTYLWIAFPETASEKAVDSVAETALMHDAQVSGTHQNFLSRFMHCTSARKVGTSPELSALRKEVRAFLEGQGVATRRTA